MLIQAALPDSKLVCYFVGDLKPMLDGEQGSLISFSLWTAGDGEKQVNEARLWTDVMYISTMDVSGSPMAHNHLFPPEEKLN